MPLAARNSVLARVEAEMTRYEERPKQDISLRFSDDDGAVEEIAIDPVEFRTG